MSVTMLTLTSRKTKSGRRIYCVSRRVFRKRRKGRLVKISCHHKKSSAKKALKKLRKR